MDTILSELKKQIEYSPSTGEFRWLVGKTRAPKGALAGFDCHGYTRIKIKQQTYSAHRLAWLFHYGVWPKKQLDHINGDRADNRVSNLREASNWQNGANRAVQSRSRTGFKGVVRMGNRFRAKCKVDKAEHYLGTFDTPEEASKAYVQFARKHHGQFFNTNIKLEGDSKMARAKSVVLTKEEKKAVMAELKGKIKAAKDNVKQLAGIRKEADKVFAAASKAHVAAMKDNDKASEKATKELAALEAQLASLTEPVAA